MAQRDYEDQPEAPDLGASVQLESGETLEAPAGDNDGLDAGYVPPDRPYGLDDDQVSSEGMHQRETLDERLRRERPEEAAADPERSGRITIAGEGAALETPDAMDGVDVGIDGGAASAEEAAVHEAPDDMNAAGAPVETEPSVAAAPALADPELDASMAEDQDADRALADAARDGDADGDLMGGDLMGGDLMGRDRADVDRAGGGPAGGEPVAEGSEPDSGLGAQSGGAGGGAMGGGTPRGGGRDGRGPDPARRTHPADLDPAARIDADRDAGGAAASAAGNEDAGPGTGL